MRRILTVLLVLACAASNLIAQAPGPNGARTPAPAASASMAKGESVVPPPDYVIGPNDVLSIMFWRDKDMSADVTVRPDGKISVPLLNDITAAGLTPEQLRVKLVEATEKIIDDPNITIGVKEIRSRNVFITGNVAKPSMYPMTNQMTVLQLIAVAGGVLEYADSKHIGILRLENGKQTRFDFNYKDVVKGKYPAQNIVLKPGDTVNVP
jgi:polysaccharide biosynthesis/export protein